jgi:hypothetical protein
MESRRLAKSHTIWRGAISDRLRIGPAWTSIIKEADCKEAGKEP